MQSISIKHWCDVTLIISRHFNWLESWSGPVFCISVGSPYKRNMLSRNGSSSLKQDVHYIKYKCSIMYRLHLWKIYLDIISKYFIINSLACALIFKEWLTPLAHLCRTTLWIWQLQKNIYILCIDIKSMAHRSSLQHCSQSNVWMSTCYPHVGNTNMTTYTKPGQ